MIYCGQEKPGALHKNMLTLLNCSKIKCLQFNKLKKLRFLIEYSLKINFIVAHNYNCIYIKKKKKYEWNNSYLICKTNLKMYYK